jgi:hypothetical protein
MAILKCQYAEDFTRKVTEGASNRNEYEIHWLAEFSRDQPDLTGPQVLQTVRTQTVGPQFDRVNRVGENYSLLGFTDNSSECETISCELEDPKNPFIWRIIASFKPPSDQGELNFLPPSNPIQWPVKHWVEVEDEQTIVEKAFCLTNNLQHIQRGPQGGVNAEDGAVVNAAGQQTIDPLFGLRHNAVLCSLVNYPTALYAVALNEQFDDTVHCHSSFLPFPELANPINSYYTVDLNIPDPPFLMGAPHFTWKFLGAEADKEQFKNVLTGEEGQEGSIVSVRYCPTVIRLQFHLGELLDKYKDLNGEPFETGADYRFHQGWIRKVLNNGQTCFRKWESKVSQASTEQWILDPRFPLGANPQVIGRKMLLPTTVMQVKEGFDLGYEDKRAPTGVERPQPTIDDMEEVETSEPINLNFDGTQITDPIKKPTHLYYLNLEPANYYHITDAFGVPIYPQNVTMPTFPLPFVLTL